MVLELKKQNADLVAAIASLEESSIIEHSRIEYLNAELGASKAQVSDLVSELSKRDATAPEHKETIQRNLVLLRSQVGSSPMYASVFSYVSEESGPSCCIRLSMYIFIISRLK